MNVISKYAVTDADKFLRHVGLDKFYLQDMSENVKCEIAGYLVTIEVRDYNKPTSLKDPSASEPEIVDYWASKGVKVQVKRV
ncbi:hypothetical protein ACI3E1_06180 [Ligilactobacillus sp. LYQ139]|uniref:hypothetical protein n=1 Tax=Ligilactobacillus sp. LYQ139 TaxID=3378800 RepID=UPI0038534D0F